MDETQTKSFSDLCPTKREAAYSVRVIRRLEEQGMQAIYAHRHRDATDLFTLANRLTHQTFGYTDSFGEMLKEID